MTQFAALQERPYDLIVYGATGYIGSLIARYLTAHAPTTLSWAVAGRSQSKLYDLQADLRLRAGGQDRKPPGIIKASLNQSELKAMVSQARVLLNTVGPFCRYGTQVVEACIDNSTAYVDTTGEHVWTHEMTCKLHEKAQSKGVIVVPQCAVESAPPDILSYMLATCISKRIPAHPTSTGPLRFSIRHRWPGIGSGPIVSGLASLSKYSLSQINRASAPLASTVPDAGPHNPYPSPVLPVRHEKFLGPVTFNPSALADRAVVMRTWSLLQRYGGKEEKYGERFSFTGYTSANNLLAGWLQFLGLSTAVAFIIMLPPLRWLIQYLAPQIGPGPTVHEGEKWSVEWKAVAEADLKDGGAEATAVGVMLVDVDVFTCCAILAAEAASTLVDDLGSLMNVDDRGSLAMRLGGGVLTPASLGSEYIERLQRAGFRIRVGWQEDGMLA